MTSNILRAISNYAKAADVGIEDMRFEIDGKQIDKDSGVSEEARTELVQFMHLLSEPSNDLEAHLKAISIHRGKDKIGNSSAYAMELADESDGTRKLMVLAPAIESVLTKGGLLLVDGIEKELHPALVEFIVAKFQSKRPTQMELRLFLQRTTPNCWTWNCSEKTNSILWTRMERACRNYMASVISRLAQQRISAKDTFLENMGQPQISKLRSCDKMLRPWQSQLCDIQGRLFENAGKVGYNSEQFIKQFMTSSLAKELDSTYNRMQWAGEEYLLEEFADRCPDAPKDGKLYDNEVLYWAGYVYRYWHFVTGESSKEIYKQAPAETMNTNYLMFHCMDTELAIEDLKEIYRQKTKKRSRSGRKAMSGMIQSD